MRARGLLMHSGSALETGLRAALLEDGRVALGQLLQDCADLVDAAYNPPTGQHFIERRKINLETIFGPVEMWRNYYCRGRDAGCPAPPSQIPACSFPAPGSSPERAWRLPQRGWPK